MTNAVCTRNKQNAVGSDGQYPLSGSKPSHSRADVLCSWKDFCPPVWSEMCFILPGTESREGVLLCLGEQFLFFLFSSTFLPSCSAPVITDSHRQQGAGKVFYQYPKPQAGWLTHPLSLWAPSTLGLQDNLTVPLVFSS